MDNEKKQWLQDVGIVEFKRPLTHIQTIEIDGCGFMQYSSEYLESTPLEELKAAHERRVLYNTELQLKLAKLKAEEREISEADTQELSKKGDGKLSKIHTSIVIEIENYAELEERLNRVNALLEKTKSLLGEIDTATNRRNKIKGITINLDGASSNPQSAPQDIDVSEMIEKMIGAVCTACDRRVGDDIRRAAEMASVVLNYKLSSASLDANELNEQEEESLMKSLEDHATVTKLLKEAAAKGQSSLMGQA